MSQSQLAARIDSKVKEALETVCESRGLKMNRFVEDAILDKIEEFEDIEDLKKLRREPTRPFEKVVANLKKAGKL